MTESANDQIIARIKDMETNLVSMNTRLVGTQAAMMIAVNHLATTPEDCAFIALELMTYRKEHEGEFPPEYFEAFDVLQNQIKSRY